MLWSVKVDCRIARHHRIPFDSIAQVSLDSSLSFLMGPNTIEHASVQSQHVSNELRNYQHNFLCYFVCTYLNLTFLSHFHDTIISVYATLPPLTPFA